MRSVVCQHAELRRRRRGPSRRRARGRFAWRCCAAGSAAPTSTRATASTTGPTWPRRWATSASAAPTSRSSSATSSPARSPSTGRAAAQDVPTGAPVVALPLLRGAHGIDPIGLSADAPGAYAEQVLVQESLMMPRAQRAARRRRGADRADGRRLARRAPRRGAQAHGRDRDRLRAGRARGDPVPEGEGRARRSSPADFSPGRRALARACGADVVVDPAEGSPYTAADGDEPPHRRAGRVRAGGRHAREARTPAGRLVARLAARPRRSARGPSTRSIFECVGAPGVIESIIEGAPLFSRVVVVGVCVGADRFTPGDGDQQGDRPALRARPTRRSSSATRCTCWPRARSIRGR